MTDNEIYQGHLLNQVRLFARDNIHVDVNVIVEDKIYPCHKIILCASSIYFERMFTSGFTEAQHPHILQEVRLENVSKGAFDVIHSYIYSGVIVMGNANVFEVYDTFDMLLYDEAKTMSIGKIIQKVRRDRAHCLQYWLESKKRDMPAVMDITLPIIIQKYDMVSQDADFVHLPFDVLLYMITLDEIGSTNEGSLLRSVIRWIENHPEITTIQYQKLIGQIRWGLLKPEDFDEFSLLCSSVPRTFTWAMEDFSALFVDWKEIVTIHTGASVNEKILLEEKYGVFFRSRGFKINARFSYNVKNGPHIIPSDDMNPHIAAVVCGNHIVVIERSMLAFDMKNHSWTTLAPADIYENVYTYAAVYRRGKIVVVSHMNTTSRVNVYDVMKNEWTTELYIRATSIPFGVCYNDEVYMCGGTFEWGYYLYKYDMLRNEWLKLYRIRGNCEVDEFGVSNDKIYMRRTHGLDMVSYDGKTCGVIHTKPQQMLTSMYAVIIPDNLPINKAEL